jgi:hypothetical protein
MQIMVLPRHGGKPFILLIYTCLGYVLRLMADNEMTDVTTQDALAPTQVPLLA